ncbi:MAG: RQC-minor-1 family DNA-binding protein [Chloroflexi bacterium]|nr:RQC-minor-1 family DNA-binding protein [Chloroflexota bacterium]
MSRRVQRVKYHLDPMKIKELPSVEIKSILRGADELIAHGGRSLLAKVLKGSCSKEVLNLHLNQSPVYGYYRGLSEDDVLARIDWVILNGYLRLEYDYRLPLLVYTEAGCDRLLETGQRPYDMSFLKDKSRDLVWFLLDKILTCGDPKYIPVLEDWKLVDYKKVKERIQQVISHLS